MSQGSADFRGHTLLVGGNNAGKSTICEALDLILGPERLFRRPVIDEHDFYGGKYLDGAGKPLEVRLQAILIDLSEEAQRRFFGHMRRWNDETEQFVDDEPDGLGAADAATTVWALPVIFIGRYDAEEDDFVGNTFFDHPVQDPEELDEVAEIQLGQGRTVFSRPHKRLCGFVYLRALRTGSRAFSLQRGSLLDTVLRLGDGSANEMWLATLQQLREMDPSIGDIKQLKEIRTQIQARLSRFVSLAPGEASTAFFASDLTREHLREVVRLFIAAEPGHHLVPFAKLGTGSINLLVFALLTFIADLKHKSSVIFAMEEPETALPPHTQRRLTKYVLDGMGQALVTSHSPYVIEQFEPSQIVMLNRSGDGTLSARQVDASAVPPRTFRKERHQFAEAVLSRAVLVVEGSTEAALFPVASAVIEQDPLGLEPYMGLDFDGVTVFDAKGHGGIPTYGPIFSDLGKKAFAFYDKLPAPNSAAAQEKLSRYDQTWESPEKGIENLLVKETPLAVIRRFMAEVSGRDDYPSVEKYDAGATDAVVQVLAAKVLKARKGDAANYAALLVAQCRSAAELPATVHDVLLQVYKALNPPAAVPVVEAEAADATQEDILG